MARVSQGGIVGCVEVIRSVLSATLTLPEARLNITGSRQLRETLSREGYEKVSGPSTIAVATPHSSPQQLPETLC